MSSGKIEVGSIVEPMSNEYTLASGCSRYDNAIVVQLDPFVLVSEGTDMRWGRCEAKNYSVIGTASDDVLKACMERL